MARCVLLLDLDGTLVDSAPDLMGSANRLMAARRLAPFTQAEVIGMVGDGVAALVERAMAARGREAGQADRDAFIADYMAHAAAETRPYPGVAETLERLADEDWRIGVCTNKPEAAARRLLDALGLLGRFEAVGGGDTFAARKPDPLHVLGLLSMMGAGPGEAVMVGDHHNDVLAAGHAGVPCIFARWGYGNLNMAEGCAGTAQTFSELPELLASVAARPG